MPTKGPNPIYKVNCTCGWCVSVEFNPALCGYTKDTGYTCICGKEYRIIDYYNGLTRHEEK